MQRDSMHTARRPVRGPFFLTVGVLAAALAACGDAREDAARDAGARVDASADRARPGTNVRGGYDVDEYEGGENR